MIGVPGDSNFSSEGRKVDWSPTGQPRFSASCFSRQTASNSCLALAQDPHSSPSQNKQQSPQMSTSPTAAPCPARGSPRQHLASSVIHSDAQLDFLFVFYIVATPLVTPARPSKGMLRARRRPCHPPLAHDLPRDADLRAQSHPTHLSISRAAMMRRHREDRTTATTARAVVWSYALGGCSTGSRRPWQRSP